MTLDTHSAKTNLGKIPSHRNCRVPASLRRIRCGATSKNSGQRWASLALQPDRGNTNVDSSSRTFSIGSQSMKRKFAKALLAFGILAVAAVIVHTALVLHPTILFRHRIELGRFTVYSDKPISADFEAVVTRADSILSGSGIEVQNFKIRIILSHDHFYNRLTGHRNLAYSTHFNAVLAGETDTSANEITKGQSGLRLNLTSTLAHEMVHCVQEQQNGFVQTNFINRPPFWKKEGYCEYISQREILEREDYQLSRSISALLANQGNRKVPGWLTLEDGFDRPLPYFRARLMVEYLMDIEGMDFEEVMNSDVQESDVYEKMIRWQRTRAEQPASGNPDKPDA